MAIPNLVHKWHRRAGKSQQLYNNISTHKQQICISIKQKNMADFFSWTLEDSFCHFVSITSIHHSECYKLHSDFRNTHFKRLHYQWVAHVLQVYLFYRVLSSIFPSISLLVEGWTPSYRTLAAWNNIVWLKLWHINITWSLTMKLTSHELINHSNSKFLFLILPTKYKGNHYMNLPPDNAWYWLQVPI